MPWKDKEKARSHHALYRIKWREKRKLAAKKYREENRARLNAQGRRLADLRYANRIDAGLCTTCGKAPPTLNLTRCLPCHEHVMQAGKKSRIKLFSQIRQHYGEKCACCGESHPVFLTLDHINGGGAEDRLKYGPGAEFYTLLRRRGFPPGFQTLCWNCNIAKHRYGKCPHELPSHS